MKYILQPKPHQARQNCINAILAAPDGYVVEIKKPVKTKTDPQTRALFGVAYPVIMDALGYEGDDEKEFLHHNFCGDFFGWKKVEIMGKVKQTPVRTTTRNEEGKRELVSTEVMANFYAFIQRRAAEYGVLVPDPDPMLRA